MSIEQGGHPHAQPSVRSDTGVYTNGEGYERLMLVDGWDPNSPRRLARLFVRVDRLPAKSRATIDVRRADSEGWTVSGGMPAYLWWFDMPGFERAGQRRADSATYKVLSMLNQSLADMALFNGV